MAEINSLLTFSNNSVDDSLTYFNMSFISRFKDNSDYLEISKSVLDDYLPELKAMAKTVTLDDSDLAKYGYKPELLAYEYYGSVELAFVILLLNGMTSPKEFNVKKIKMLTVEDCLTAINTIYNAEEELINKNHIKEREE